MTPRKPQGGKLLDPAWRQRRAMAGGLANRAAQAAKARERGERYADKNAAYVAGYAMGVQSRDRYWRAKYQRLLAQMRRAA